MNTRLTAMQRAAYLLFHEGLMLAAQRKLAYKELDQIEAKYGNYSKNPDFQKAFDALLRKTKGA